MSVASVFKKAREILSIAHRVAESSQRNFYDEMVDLIKEKSPTGNHKVVLENGQKCFVTPSQIIFCTDEKGVYKPVRRNQVYSRMAIPKF